MFPQEIKVVLLNRVVSHRNKTCHKFFVVIPPKSTAEDLLKSYKTLAGPKAPLIKKRQLMRMLFGDYRQKMADEEKKFKIGK